MVARVSDRRGFPVRCMLMIKRLDCKNKRETGIREREGTHVSLDVLVLEVERVLPDIDANNGDMAEERVLVSRSSNLETLVRRVQSLHRIHTHQHHRFTTTTTRKQRNPRASPSRIPEYQQW